MQLTETWIKEGNTVTPTRLCPKGYKSLSISRHDKIGHGIATVSKSELNISSSRDEPYKTMELSSFIISTGNKQLNLTAIYRPPNTNVFEFCSELASLLENNINSSSELLLLGDFNIAVNKPSDSGPAAFLDVLDSFNLINKVNEPTHRLANTLNLIILDANSNTIPRLTVDWLFSNHNMILFDMSLPHTSTIPEVVKVYRKTNNINPEAFIRDIGEFHLHKPLGSSLEDKVNYYHSMLQSILGVHAPIKRHKCSNQPSIPWFNQEIAEAIRRRRHLERVWYRDKSNREALALFHSQCQFVASLLDKAEQKFFLTSIIENSANYKCIYEICNNLLGRSKDTPLPPSIPNKDLAVSFNNYFIEMIAKICSDLIEKCLHLPPYIETQAPLGTHNLSNFQPITLPELQKLIHSTSNKNCALDPIPTVLLKQILPSIAALISDIINTSLRDGIVPESFKRALVKPLLKKPGLELLEKNYRLVSNLSYISKLVEHVMAAQLVSHIESQGMMEAHQSAYCPSHSTETALLKVKTDIIQALDNQEVACLILLDLSAAFDTIDHDILLNRLKSRFAVNGVALGWPMSYLKDRSLVVEIGVHLSGGSRSEYTKIQSGIPQGSLGSDIVHHLYSSYQ